MDTNFWFAMDAIKLESKDFLEIPVYKTNDAVRVVYENLILDIRKCDSGGTCEPSLYRDAVLYKAVLSGKTAKDLSTKTIIDEFKSAVQDDIKTMIIED